MNQVSDKQKDSVLKSLAIAGFIGLIILIAWLSIQLVQVIPSAFSSLASLAESVYQTDPGSEQVEEPLPQLTVTNDQSIINAGEAATVSWDPATQPGSYTFSYTCTDGVAIDLVDVDGIRSIACDTNYNIGDASSLSLLIDSEKERYVDVEYTIAFLATNDTEPRASGSDSITVVNTAIANILGTAAEEAETTTPVVPATPTITEEAAMTIPEPTTPSVGGGTSYQQEFVYTIPTSDPNGRTDLATRFLANGTIVGDTFFAGTIVRGESGAVQFEVKNLGTKTSGDWSFTVSLPDGTTYRSATQQPLKPNEQAVLTIGFPEAAGASHDFTVKLSADSDSNSLNNRFIQTVQFVR